jgi:hypothetical protein
MTYPQKHTVIRKTPIRFGESGMVIATDVLTTSERRDPQ